MISDPLLGRLLWGRERSLDIWRGISAMCSTAGLTAENAADLADMRKLIEAEDFSPFGGAMDPYYRIQGRLIQAMNHRSEKGKGKR